MIANATKLHHEVKVKIKTNPQGTSAVPDIPTDMHQGDTVHYSRFEDGPGLVTIKFNPGFSPFVDSSGKEKTEVFSTDPPLELVNQGKFACICSVTLPGEAPTAWGPDMPEAGGNHIVK